MRNFCRLKAVKWSIKLNKNNQTFKPRIAVVLVGDTANEPDARAKYCDFLTAVDKQFSVVESYNAKLRGWPKFVSAILSIHPNKTRWKQRFRKNEFSFSASSKHVANHLNSLGDQFDVVLQLGALFNARWANLKKPYIIYTDYTAMLSAKKPEAGRSPFTDKQRERWFALERHAYEQATQICTRSQYVRASIINDYGIAPKRVTVIGGGVNFASLPEPHPRNDTRPPTALFIGRDFYRKGGDVLLQAFTRVRAQLPESKLLLLTRDTIPDNFSLEGVELVEPTWDREGIAALYRRADLLVLPSRLETWGDVLLEAMAFGLPCIGVLGEAMEEIIEDGVTGLLTPAEDVDALATAMVDLLGDIQKCQTWGSVARQQIEQQYTWDHVIDRLAPIINESVGLY